MINRLTPHRFDDLTHSLDAMIDAYGVRPVFLAALRALLKPPPKTRAPHRGAPVSPHLRRDVGLPPEAGKQHWTSHF